nr:MAG TPA: hypothetical protein [Caudoviricetes sp.]DAV39556.1 MAG TPA: hypothetical protein [Caudoviricetes sp.]
MRSISSVSRIGSTLRIYLLLSNKNSQSIRTDLKY